MSTPLATYPPRDEAAAWLTFKDVMQRVGLGKSRIYDLLRERKFPLPAKPGGRRNLWLASEVDAWLDNLLANRELGRFGGR